MLHRRPPLSRAGATLLQQMAVPAVSVARDLQRLQRDEPDFADRILQRVALGEARAQIVVDGQVETSVARQQQRFRLHRQLELQTQQAEHVRHDIALQLTADHLKGKRKPYVSPLHLFLVANVIFFLLHAAAQNGSRLQITSDRGDVAVAVPVRGLLGDDAQFTDRRQLRVQILRQPFREAPADFIRVEG